MTEKRFHRGLEEIAEQLSAYHDQALDPRLRECLDAALVSVERALAVVLHVGERRAFKATGQPAGPRR